MFPQEATGEELLMEGIKSEKRLFFKYVDDFEESSECYTKMAIILWNCRNICPIFIENDFEFFLDVDSNVSILISNFNASFFYHPGPRTGSYTSYSKKNSPPQFLFLNGEKVYKCPYSSLC